MTRRRPRSHSTTTFFARQWLARIRSTGVLLLLFSWSHHNSLPHDNASSFVSAAAAFVGTSRTTTTITTATRSNIRTTSQSSRASWPTTYYIDSNFLDIDNNNRVRRDSRTRCYEGRWQQQEQKGDSSSIDQLYGPLRSGGNDGDNDDSYGQDDQQNESIGIDDSEAVAWSPPLSSLSSSDELPPLSSKGIYQITTEAEYK